MQVRPCGDRALLVEYDDLDQVLAAYSHLAASPPEGVVDLVPASCTLLLHFDAAVTDASRVAESVRAVDPGQDARPDADLMEVPVTYDGADLAEVAALTGLSEAEVVAAHTGQGWRVAFCGFAPGFGYLTGEDDRLHVRRRTNPRTSVPAGAVALAGEFSGVYPRSSPGGWQLIGHTDLAVWDLDRDPPALLAPGVRVRFVEAT